MVKTRLLLVLLLCCCLPSLAGDGKMFVTRGAPPPTIPAQRALIVHDAGVQTMVLQSGYNMSPGEMVDSASLGWVVPVPGVPEVGAYDASYAIFLFSYLVGMTLPEEIHIGSIVLLSALVAGVLAITVFTVLRLLAADKIVRRLIWWTALGLLCWVVAMLWLQPDVEKWAVTIFLGVLVASGLGMVVAVALGLISVCRGLDGDDVVGAIGKKCVLWSVGMALWLFAIIYVWEMPTYMQLSVEGVEILDHRQVGIYDVRVIAGDDAADIIAWLDDQGFAYDGEDQAVFASYVEQGWCFVVVRINEAVVSDAVEVRMLQPLVMRFAHPQPVYPLALTGTGGHDTHVELHVIASQQMADDGRLPRIFAGSISVGRNFSGYFDHDLTDPPGMLIGCLPEQLYLTTFSGLLSPDDMATDLILTPAPERSDYREWDIKW